MKKKDITKLKEMLVDDRKKILRHLEDLSSSSEKELNMDTGDSADIASVEMSQANMEKIGRREKYLLQKIDYSLQKLEDGTYGECENCGEEIAVKRLIARPVAQLCIDCKTEQESGERRFLSAEGREDGESLDVEEEG